MIKQVENTIVLAVLFLALFAVTELLYHQFKVSINYTRKIVHAGTGLLTLLFPVLLVSLWQIFILCASFALILVISKKFNRLKSIHSIDRFSYGSVLYPVAVCCCFYIYHFNNNNLIFFYLPVLILAICDPVAAFIGSRWPYGVFKISNSVKTISGSAAFFVSCLIISEVLFYFLSTKNQVAIFPLILFIAVISTIAEAISIMGFDNITIPAGVLLVLTLFG